MKVGGLCVNSPDKTIGGILGKSFEDYLLIFPGVVKILS